MVLSRSLLLWCCGLFSSTLPNLNVNVHPDPRMLLELEFPHEPWSPIQVACESPQLAHVRFGRRGHATTQLLNTLTGGPAIQTPVCRRHQGPSSCRFGCCQFFLCVFVPSFLLSRCADRVGALHDQRLDEDLRVSSISLVLPSRRAHTDDTIGDLLLLALIFSRPHDFLADFFACSHSSTREEVISVHQASDVLLQVAVQCDVVSALCELTVRHKLPHLPLAPIEIHEEESDFVFACSFLLEQVDAHLPRHRSLKESS